MDQAPLGATTNSFGGNVIGFEDDHRVGRDLFVQRSFVGSVVMIPGAGGELLVPRVEGAAEEAEIGATEQTAEGVEGIVLTGLGAPSQYSTSVGCYAVSVITPNPGIARNIARHYIRQGGR